MIRIEIFRTRTFSRWMKRAGISDKALCQAVVEMRNGLVDADLGGHVVKKRLAREGQGKRGGARTLVATNIVGRWFFLYGFNKNEQSNISKRELRALQEVASVLLDMDDGALTVALAKGELTQVHDDRSK